MDLVGLYRGKVYVVYVYSPLWPDKQLNLSFVFPCLFVLLAEFFFKNFLLSDHGALFLLTFLLEERLPAYSQNWCPYFALAKFSEHMPKSTENFSPSLSRINSCFLLPKICVSLLPKIGVTAKFTAKNWRYC